jgi:hypothetical protein
MYTKLTVMLLFPRIISPASMSLSTMAAFLDALAVAKAMAPAQVGMPSFEEVMKQSYT